MKPILILSAILLVIVFILPQPLQSQTPTTKAVFVRAPKAPAGLRDSIQAYIMVEKIQDSLFNKYGYLVLKVDRTNTSNDKPCFRVSKSYYYYYNDFSENRFPSYYTFEAGKMVLLYTDFEWPSAFYPVNKNQKDDFIKLVNQQLEKRPVETVIDDKGNTLHLRPVGDIVPDGGKRICI